MPIRYFDMFAGIGGFRSALEAIGGFECVGYCEIDKYALQAYEAMYDTRGELFFEDARKIVPEQLPDIDLICGGFPCQSFSIAGARKGFDDTRGTLFFEIARIAAVKRPEFLLLENVQGLLSHDKGKTFETILSALDGLGYSVAWQVLNSKNFKVPQSRNRVYIVGCLGEKCCGEGNFTQGVRVYSADGTSITLTSEADGVGGKTGLYLIEGNGLPIISKTKDGYQIAFPGDSIDTAFADQNSRRGRVGSQIAHTLTTSSTQACYCVDMNPDPKFTEIARCITTRQDSGIGTHKGEHSGVFVEEIQPLDMDDPEKFALIFFDENGDYHIGRIRKLTPRECWRLQGFKDRQFDKVAATGMSDSKLYRMAGNAVTVDVVMAVGQVIKNIWERDVIKNGLQNRQDCDRILYG